MQNKIVKKLFTLFAAFVMTVCSAVPAAAAEPSPGSGDIVPDPVITARTTSVIVKDNSINVSYRQENAVKYMIQYKSANGTWDHCRTITTTDLSAVIAKLARGGRYDIRVCGINENGKAGAYSTAASRFVRSCSANVTSRKGGFNVKVTKTNTGVTGYKIYWTNDKSFKRFNVITVKGSTLNKSIAGKKGKTYYVRVVPISEQDGTVYTGVQNRTHTAVVK